MQAAAAVLRASCPVAGGGGVRAQVCREEESGSLLTDAGAQGAVMRA